jgi:ATP dependent DNA ligase domain/DNA ligase OB-like domain
VRVYNILEELRATSSRNEKEAILKKNINDDELKETFRLALDPMTQFYQRKIPEYKPKTKSTLHLTDAFVALGDLSSRKVTGNAAIEYLRNLLESINSSDARVIECIIQKDPDCGVQASTVNKVWKDLIHEYPCMLASGYDEKLIDKVQFPALVQLKMDGMRFNAIVDANNKSVEYRSRNGKEVAVNNDLIDAAFLQMAKNIGMANVVFDGELIVVDEKGKLLDRKTGNGILNKAVKGTISDDERAQVRATIWDVIPLLYFRQGKCDVDYETRLGTVVVAIDNLGGNLKHLVSVVETTIADSLYKAQKIFETYHAAGQEGIILKTRDGIWEDKRAKHQIKFKGELECDLLCVDWEEGTGKNKGKLGALVLQSSDGKINVSVGTGLTDEMRSTLTPKKVKGKIVTVKYNARISSKNKGEDSLFLPVFLEIREDKTTADSSKKIK